MKRHHLKNLFIEHSLKNVLDFFREAVFSEEIARSRGLLQLLSPKVKIIILVACLIMTVFARSVGFLLALYLVTILLALSSGINIIFFLKRVWFFIPIFTLFIAIPAVFMEGWHSAVLFVMRVTTCVSFAIVFTITTSHDRLIKSLRSVGLPPVFVDVLDMTQRYLFLFMKVFEEMHLSLKSRLVKDLGPKRSRRWIASRIAFLFRRSLKMSEDVYMAMLARGYAAKEKEC